MKVTDSTQFWVWDIKTIGPISSSELQNMYDSGELKGGLCRSSADNAWLALDDFFENGKLKEKLPTMADQIRYAKYQASRADHRTHLEKIKFPYFWASLAFASLFLVFLLKAFSRL